MSLDAKILRLLIVDDHDEVRHTLVRIFRRDPRLEVAGEAVDGVEAIEQARALDPDVIVMDVGMPRLDGIAATEAIHTEMPHVTVIGFSMHDEDEIEQMMIRAGAVKYVRKDEPIDHLLQALLQR